VSDSFPQRSAADSTEEGGGLRGFRARIALWCGRRADGGFGPKAGSFPEKPALFEFTCSGSGRKDAGASPIGATGGAGPGPLFTPPPVRAGLGV